MEFKTKPGYVINRGGERIIADDDGIIKTENQEAIEVLSVLFPNPKKEEGKSKAKK